MSRDTFYIVATACFFVVIGALLQAQGSCSGDVRYLLYAAWQMWNGGHYVSEIFETNPPMVLYWYMPIAFLGHYWGLGVVPLLRGYVFLLAFTSGTLCCYLLNQLKGCHEYALKNLFFFTIFFVLCILPLHEFAQREHLFLIVLLPYLFLAMLRLDGGSISPVFAVCIGVAAGLGFALKPFFLITYVLIEGFLLRKAGIRIEALAVIGVLWLYGIALYVGATQYLYKMLPWVMHYYFPFAKQGWIAFFSPPYVLFCLSMITSYWFFYRSDRTPHVGLVLWLALVGSTGAFFSARSSWYYHVIPALAFAYLLAVYCLMGLFKRFHLALIVGGIIFIVPFYNHYLAIQYWLRPQPAVAQVIEAIKLTSDRPSLICYPLGTRDCFQGMNLNGREYATRFPSLWWYQGLRSLENKKNSPEITQDKLFFISLIAEDLQHYQPKFVIFNNAILPAAPMLEYFGQNAAFERAWQSYRYKITIKDYQVYERADS